MAKPISEKISDEILARLALITTANGYEFTVASVSYVSRDLDDWPKGPLSIVVNKTETVDNDELSCPGNPPRLAFDATFTIHGYASVLDTDDSEVGIVDSGVSDFEMAAAIQKAITTDTAAWETMDGNAVFSKLTRSESFDAPDRDGAMWDLVVTYRTPENDPYTAG